MIISLYLCIANKIIIKLKKQNNIMNYCSNYNPDKIEILICDFVYYKESPEPSEAELAKVVHDQLMELISEEELAKRVKEYELCA